MVWCVITSFIPVPPCCLFRFFRGRKSILMMMTGDVRGRGFVWDDVCVCVCRIMWGGGGGPGQGRSLDKLNDCCTNFYSPNTHSQITMETLMCHAVVWWLNSWDVHWPFKETLLPSLLPSASVFQSFMKLLLNFVHPASVLRLVNLLIHFISIKNNLQSL